MPGNTGVEAVAFTVDASFEDMRGLIDDLACTRGQRNQLTAQLDQAVRAGRRGQTSKAIRELRDLKDLVDGCRCSPANCAASCSATAMP